MATTKSQSTIDLKQARSNATFDPAVLERLWNEGSRDLDMRKRVADIIRKDKQMGKAGR